MIREDPAGGSSVVFSEEMLFLWEPKPGQRQEERSHRFEVGWPDLPEGLPPLEQVLVCFAGLLLHLWAISLVFL